VTSAEEWVIKAIAAGLIEARLDQRRRIIVVTRSTQREFQVRPPRLALIGLRLRWSVRIWPTL
jgi:hypothetical protein